MLTPDDSMRSRRPSNRFIVSARPAGKLTGLGSVRREVFADGGWLSIRLLLEERGWSPSHVDQIHEQLRQGWPLAMAVRQVAMRMGTCPMRSKSLG